MDKPPKEVSKNGRLRVVLIIIGVIAFGLMLVWGRAFYGSMQAYQKGEVFLKKGEYVRAITFFDRSIHWYTPFNPYIEKSAERLWDIGKHAEGQGDTKLALIAYRTIRQGFYGASHFVTPGRDWIEKCELKINDLVMMEEKRDTDEIASLREKLSEGEKDPSPVILWTVILEIGFLGWIGSLICFIVFALRRKGEAKVLTPSALIWLALAATFFTLWIVGMMKA